MGRGVVAQVSQEGIRVALDKRLRPAFASHAQSVHSSDSLGPGGFVRWAGGALPGETAVLSWRLDKDDVASVFVRLRRNLMGAYGYLLSQHYGITLLYCWVLSALDTCRGWHPSSTRP